MAAEGEDAGKESEGREETPRIGDLKEGRLDALRRRAGALRDERRRKARAKALAGKNKKPDTASGEEGTSLPAKLRERAGGWLTGGRKAAARGGAVAGKAARATREAASEGADVVADGWFRMPLVVRQRIAAGAGLVLLVLFLFLVVVPNAPCAFPGGDRCPPEDEAISLVPADTGAYFHANLDSETDQIDAALELQDSLPTALRRSGLLLAPLVGRPVEWERDIAAWTGGEIAVALSADGTDASRLLLVEVESTEGADQFTESLLGPGASEVEVEGSTVRVAADRGSGRPDDEPLAAGRMSGFLVVGPENEVRESAELAANPAGDSLASDASASAALGELPDERVAEVYVSEGLASVLESSGVLGSLDAFVNVAAAKGFAAGVVLEDDAVELAVRSVQDPESEEPSFFEALPAFEPELDQRVQADAFAYLGLGDPEETAQTVVERAASVSAPLRRAFAGFARRLGKDGVDIEAELLPLLTGEVALTVEPKSDDDEGADEGGEEDAEGESTPGVGTPSVAPPYVALLADDVDEGAALERLAELQAPLAAAIDPAAGQAPVFEQGEVDGVETQSLRVSPSVALTYAASEDLLIVGSDPVAVPRALSGDDSLAGSDAYEDAVDGLPDDVALLLYLNAPDLLNLGEVVADLALNPLYAELAPDLRTLTSAALAIDASPSLLSTDVRIAVGEPQDG